MHIVFVIQRFPGYGGAEEYVHRLASGLVDSGYKCTVITSNLNERHPFFDYTEKVQVIRLPVVLKVGEYGIWRGLTGKVLKMRADILHVNTYGYWHTDMLAILRHIKPKLKTVFTSHGWEGFEGSLLFKKGILPKNISWLAKMLFRIRPFYDNIFGRLEARSFDALIALSLREVELFKWMGAEPDKIHYILPGVNEMFLKDTGEEEMIQDSWREGPFLLSVGRLHWQKGQEIIVKAMRYIIQDYPSAKLFLIGKDFGLLEKLMRLVKSYNLERNMVFKGYVDLNDLLNHYKTSDIFIHASYAEGTSFVVLQAIASGLPIVSTPAGGISYILNQTKTGIIVPFGNIEAIYKAVKLIMGNSTLLKTMKNNALKFREKLSWKRAVKEHEEVYYEIVEK
jgi:glycosyltransferase involved in cell wall biosynthesis